MNEQARALGFYVLYPKQSLDANPSRCWNWFNRHHQQRGRGEPAFLADLTRTVIAQHDIDPRRVYIAGLSAGGAMAAIAASAYPEIFAAVGVHSGLPRGIAGNVLEALQVMKSGIAGPGLPVNANSIGFTSAAAAARARITVPTIVFHGDMDRTVHPRNGEQVIAAVLDTVRASGGAAVEQGETAMKTAGWWPSTGCCTARATHGRAGRRPAPTPTPAGPMPAAKCCASFLRTPSGKTSPSRTNRQGARMPGFEMICICWG
jgi:poly(hydroxyalkanoate) depolymerase family esterase